MKKRLGYAITFDYVIRFISFITIMLFYLVGISQSEIPASSRAIVEKTIAKELSLVMKVNDKFHPIDVKKIGGNIGSQIGDIVTLRIASNKWMALQQIEGIRYLQIAHKVSPNLSRVVPDVRADSVYMGSGLNASYTGKDVIIGVTDWGFDYTHPMFYDTAMQHTRILAAWDQFKKSGPAPDGFSYGTVYQGEEELLAAEKDTVNIYGYATHGSHVAGIAGGGGAGTEHRGVAYEANYLMVTFLVDEAAVIDAFNWMHKKAREYNKRLVINMSWGLYNLGPLDGTSMVSQAIDALSDKGVIFVTSGGNNGDVNFHIKKTFAFDTLRSRVSFYSYSANPNMYGQSISMWGEESRDFSAGFEVYKSGNLIGAIPMVKTDETSVLDSILVIGSDTIFYILEVDAPHPLNNKPHIRMRIKNTNTSLLIALKSYASTGIVHFYNVTELTTDVGNWGMPFSASKAGWTKGDNLYSLGEPASTASVITVAAHVPQVVLVNGTVINGNIANFSSIGPTIDGRMKPDISAPGVSISSSVSSFTNRDFTLSESVSFGGRDYPFSKFSGTSMSSPATAGVVALMLQANPNLRYDDAKKILQATARQDNRTGAISADGSTQWGYGKVNALAATQRAEYKYIGVKKLKKPHLALFPNPTSGVIALSTSQVLDIEIIGYDGRSITFGQLGGGHQVSLHNLSAGIYFVKFLSTDSKPLVVMKY